MAISASSYSVGNRVYRGGSSAPTVGTVDPMGYIDRELNKPSQSRSGIAAAALRRLNPIDRAKQAASGARPQSPGAYGIQTNTQQSGQVTGLGGGAPVAPAGPPKLSVGPTGKLQPPNLSASMGGTSLPFDPEAADAQQGLLAEKNRFEQEFTRGQQGLERDYTVQRRGVEDQMPDARRELLENYAGRGLAYSSGYTHDYGSLESQYANLLSQLESGKTEGIADLLRQRGMFNEEWASRLQAIQQAAARRLASQAGDLGLGGDVPSNQDVMADLFPTDPAPAPAPAPQAPTGGGGGIFDSPFKRISQAVPQQAPAPSAPAPTGISDGWRGVAPMPMTPGAPAPAPRPVTSAPAPRPQAPAPQAPRSHERTMASFDAKSRAALSQGGTIRGGNGLTYRYDPLTGRAVPV